MTDQPIRTEGGIGRYMVEQGHWTEEQLKDSKHSWDAMMWALNTDSSPYIQPHAPIEMPDDVPYHECRTCHKMSAIEVRFEQYGPIKGLYCGECQHIDTKNYPEANFVNTKSGRGIND